MLLPWTGLADDDRGWALGLVEHSSDGVVHRGRGIEGAAGGVGEPVPEPAEESRDALGWAPLAGGVEVDAEPLSLENMGVAEETSVVDLDNRGQEQRGSDPDDELFVISEFEPRRAPRNVASVKPEAKYGFAVTVQLGLLDDPNLIGTLLRERPQFGNELLLPGRRRGPVVSAHPERPDRPTIEAAAGAAAGNFALLDDVAGALNPSPKMPCHNSTLRSLSSSS
jgi:hypothetical protein